MALLMLLAAANSHAASIMTSGHLPGGALVADSLLLANLSLGAGYLLAYYHFARPIHHIRRQLAASFPKRMQAIRSPSSLVQEVTHLTRLTHRYLQTTRALQQELAETRAMLAQHTRQQHILVQATHREAIAHYQHVLAYAHYLDERITHQRLDPQLRLDLDDVSESAFTLRLIAGAMQLLETQYRPALTRMKLATVMQQTLLMLAPALDRRSMLLDSSGMDEHLTTVTDPLTFAHTLWLLVLGIIRYAEPESTLTLSTGIAGDACLLSLTVSALSAGSMLPHERFTHLLRQMQDPAPHMFADTIRLHAHIQLAELLLQRVHAQIRVEPLSVDACRIVVHLTGREI